MSRGSGRLQGRGGIGNTGRGRGSGRGGWVQKPPAARKEEENEDEFDDSKVTINHKNSVSVSPGFHDDGSPIVDGNTSKFANLVVHNKRSSFDVYIGRPGPYGNPFAIGRDGDRNDVIRKYKTWLIGPAGKEVLQKAKSELRGKVLACWCAPLACHGHVLAELVNSEIPSENADPISKISPKAKFSLLQDGVVLIREAFSLESQQEMIDLIAKYGRGDFPECGSFYGHEITQKDGYVDPVPEDSDPSSGKLNLGTKARMNIPFDKAPKIIWERCSEVLERSRSLCKSIPGMNPTVFRVNYYKNTGKIGWHFDRHPKVPLDQQHTVTSPVISVTLGNSGSFDYKNSSSEENFETVKLDSGDVIIFGGPSRLLVHRMIKVWKNTCPPGLNMHEFVGRINFAFYDN